MYNEKFFLNHVRACVCVYLFVCAYEEHVDVILNVHNMEKCLWTTDHHVCQYVHI